MQTVLWHALADIFGCHDADRSVGSDSWTVGVRHGGVWTGDVLRIPGRASQGIQELSVVDCSVLTWAEQKELC